MRTSKTSKTRNVRELLALETYVRKHFPDIKSSPAHCYFLGLPYLERTRGIRRGSPVTASYRMWAEASFLAEKTVRCALQDLAEMGLIELKVGNSRDRQASIVRRRSLHEIRATVGPNVLERYIPRAAEDLASSLAEMGTVWRGEKVFPHFSPSKIGRIFMSGPCLQNEPAAAREESFLVGLGPTEELVYSDYCVAEPTILLHALIKEGLLGYAMVPDDIYNDLASFLGISRQKAKGKLLRLFYGPLRQISLPADWRIPSCHYLHGLVGGVDDYRNTLWEIGKPCNRSPRYVDTLLGRTIRAAPRERAHRGKILSWHIQGSLADIFNQALKTIVEKHKSGELRFLLQIHDGIYAVTNESDSRVVGEVMEDTASSFGLTLKAKTKRWKGMVNEG